MLTVSDNHIVLGGGGGGGGGDVVGASSSTDNAVVRFDGATGKLLQNSGVTIDDNGVVSINTGAVNGYNLVLTKTGGYGSLFTMKNTSTLSTGLFRVFSESDAMLSELSATTSGLNYNIGSVGINTTPSAKLDVNGTSRFRGNATFNAQIVDNSGSTGTDGQVLKKVGGLVIWANP